jgi:hypothetical protein
LKNVNFLLLFSGVKIAENCEEESAKLIKGSLLFDEECSIILGFESLKFEMTSLNDPDFHIIFCEAPESVLIKA